MVVKTVLELQPTASTLLELQPTLQRLASQRRIQRRSILLDIANQNDIQGSCSRGDSASALLTGSTSLRSIHGEWSISSAEDRSDDHDTTSPTKHEDVTSESAYTQVSLRDRDDHEQAQQDDPTE